MWQSFADTLMEKINQRPTAVFAQDSLLAKGKDMEAIVHLWMI